MRRRVRRTRHRQPEPRCTSTNTPAVTASSRAAPRHDVQDGSTERTPPNVGSLKFPFATLAAGHTAAARHHFSPLQTDWRLQRRNRGTPTRVSRALKRISTFTRRLSSGRREVPEPEATPSSPAAAQPTPSVRAWERSDPVTAKNSYVLCDRRPLLAPSPHAELALDGSATSSSAPASGGR